MVSENFAHRLYRLAVRTSRCGRDNPGSNPGMVRTSLMVFDFSCATCWCKKNTIAIFVWELDSILELRGGRIFCNLDAQFFLQNSKACKKLPECITFDVHQIFVVLTFWEVVYSCFLIDDMSLPSWSEFLSKISSRVAQWLARWAHNPKVPGAKPGSASAIDVQKKKKKKKKKKIKGPFFF